MTNNDVYVVKYLLKDIVAGFNRASRFRVSVKSFKDGFRLSFVFGQFHFNLNNNNNNKVNT